MNRAYLCVEMESFLPMSARRSYYDEFHFDDPLEFDTSDEGPAGGIQVQPHTPNAESETRNLPARALASCVPLAPRYMF